MKGLTAPELCLIVGMKFQRFETLRRRYRESFAASRVIDDETFIFPVADDFGGGWTRYSFHDVLKLAITVELERQGIDFKRAARIAVNTDIPASSYPGALDSWVGRQRLIDGNVDLWEPYVHGDCASVFQPKDPTGTLVSVVACNVSAIIKLTRARLAGAGFRVVGQELHRVDD